MSNRKDGRNRNEIKPGLKVNIVLKADQKTGNLLKASLKISLPIPTLILMVLR